MADVVQCSECYDVLGNAFPVELSSVGKDVKTEAEQRAERADAFVQKSRELRPQCSRCGNRSVFDPCRRCAPEKDAKRPALQ